MGGFPVFVLKEKSVYWRRDGKRPGAEDLPSAQLDDGGKPVLWVFCSPYDFQRHADARIWRREALL